MQTSASTSGESGAARTRWTESCWVASNALAFAIPAPNPTGRGHIEGTGFGVAFVGSSNISYAALRAGIEWSLRADRQRDPGAYEAVAAAFERLWDDARPLDAEWIQEYARRAPEVTASFDEGGDDAEPTDLPPAPHAIQLAALAALDKSRESGHRRALVVLATGLGKTYLAALDVAAWARAHGRRPRVLLLAHREELLFQAARRFRRTLSDPTARFGWFVGPSTDLEADVVFASVQKLSRPEHLDRLVRGTFDYAIVDEVHHGTSPTYRSVLDRLEPGFLLGLTATPERADGADLPPPSTPAQARYRAAMPSMTSPRGSSMPSAPSISSTRVSTCPTSIGW